jgi:hypothetical protein
MATEIRLMVSSDKPHRFTHIAYGTFMPFLRNGGYNGRMVAPVGFINPLMISSRRSCSKSTSTSGHSSRASDIKLENSSLDLVGLTAVMPKQKQTVQLAAEPRPWCRICPIPRPFGCIQKCVKNKGPVLRRLKKSSSNSICSVIILL